MKALFLIREVYLQAFREIRHMLVKLYFMAFSWFCFAILLMVLYAFLSRLFSGYAFD